MGGAVSGGAPVECQVDDWTVPMLRNGGLSSRRAWLWSLPFVFSVYLMMDRDERCVILVENPEKFKFIENLL